MLQQRNECCDIMEIRRQNFVAIMDFYVVTLLEKFLKKNVATLIQANGSRELSRQSNLCSNKKI